MSSMRAVATLSSYRFADFAPEDMTRAVHIIRREAAGSGVIASLTDEQIKEVAVIALLAQAALGEAVHDTLWWDHE